MAKKSMINRQLKREALVLQYQEIRKELKAKKDYAALALLPRDSSPVRLRNRDQIDGRPRSYIRKFGLARIHFRELASKGELPGVKKASW